MPANSSLSEGQSSITYRPTQIRRVSRYVPGRPAGVPPALTRADDVGNADLHQPHRSRPHAGRPPDPRRAARPARRVALQDSDPAPATSSSTPTGSPTSSPTTSRTCTRATTPTSSTTTPGSRRPRLSPSEPPTDSHAATSTPRDHCPPPAPPVVGGAVGPTPRPQSALSPRAVDVEFAEALRLIAQVRPHQTELRQGRDVLRNAPSGRLDPWIATQHDGPDVALPREISPMRRSAGSGGRRTGFARESARPQRPLPQRERHEDPGTGDRAGLPVLIRGHHGAHERCTGQA